MTEAFQGQLDEVEQMKECLRALEATTPGAESGESSEEVQSDLKHRESALDHLADLCENLDNAAGMGNAYLFPCVLVDIYNLQGWYV